MLRAPPQTKQVGPRTHQRPRGSTLGPAGIPTPETQAAAQDEGRLPTHGAVGTELPWPGASGALTEQLRHRRGWAARGGLTGCSVAKARTAQSSRGRVPRVMDAPQVMSQPVRPWLARRVGMAASLCKGRCAHRLAETGSRKTHQRCAWPSVWLCEPDGTSQSLSTVDCTGVPSCPRALRIHQEITRRAGPPAKDTPCQVAAEKDSFSS